MEELRDIFGPTRMTLIGLRLGAKLAARVAARRPKDVDTLVLWDPILSGPDYLASLGAAAAPVASDPPLTVRGFPVTAEMHRDLRAIALAPPLTPPGARGLTLITDPGAHAPPPGPWDGKSERPDTTEFIKAVCPWIRGSRHDRRGSRRSAPADRRLAGMNQKISEQAVLFGVGRPWLVLSPRRRQRRLRSVRPSSSSTPGSSTGSVITGCSYPCRAPSRRSATRCCASISLALATATPVMMVSRQWTHAWPKSRRR